MSIVATSRGQDVLFPEGKWVQATPESQSVDSTRLEKAIDYLRGYMPGRIGADELVVIRHGRLIWEGSNADRPHQVWSVTKSITSSVLGLLIDDGRMSLDDPASKYFPELAEKYADLTVSHLVSMTSPWRAVGENRISTISDTLWIPDDPVFQPAGSQSYYSNGNYEVFSRVLTNALGQRLDDFFRDRIGDPIGMSNWTWDNWDGTVNAAPDGVAVNQGSHGMNVSAEDAARFGHLFLNDGRWNDQQIISADWVQQATSVQVDVSTPLNPLNSTTIPFGINGGPGIYGYGWWTNGKNPEGNRFLPGVPPEAFFAYGISNNMVFVVPEWDMVVVREGTNEGDRSVSNNVWATFLNLVGDAVTDVPGGDSVRGADTYTRLPYAAYRTRDSDGDGQGDRVENLLGRSTEVYRTFVGEGDVSSGTTDYRVVTKFALPDVSASDATLWLEHATLRYYLDSVVGSPAEPISVSHSVTDNDTDTLVSDYEDASYVDTHFDLFQPTDLGNQYYEIDVTTLVQSDYDADGTDAMSAFRLALLDHVIVADRQSENYQIFIAGNRAHYPELILDFGLAGDLNHDGTLDFKDIDLLSVTIQRGDQDHRSDLDRNGTVDGSDRTFWVHDLQRTWFGDANLDGEFNSSDLIAVFQAGLYEDEVSMNSTWATGDWSGDGDFDSGDLVIAFQDGGYDLGTRATASAVPEPSCAILLGMSTIALCHLRRLSMIS